MSTHLGPDLDAFDDPAARPFAASARPAHVCLACRERRSLFRYRGRVRADRDHTLCFRCYRALLDRVRARQLANAA